MDIKTIKGKEAYRPAVDEVVKIRDINYVTRKFEEYNGAESCETKCSLYGNGKGCMNIDCYNQGQPDIYMRKLKQS